MLTDSIVPEVLKMALDHQEGRGTSSVPNGTLFKFTEGWFRDSGLYELNALYNNQAKP
jgi:isocitrate dehydrogenase